MPKEGYPKIDCPRCSGTGQVLARPPTIIKGKKLNFKGLTERIRYLQARNEELEADVAKWQERFCNLADWAVAPPAVVAAITIHVQKARTELKARKKR